MLCTLMLSALLGASPRIGEKAPVFQIVNAAGMRVDPLAGSSIPTAVVFIGAECPISRLYVPSLAKLSERFAGAANVVLIAPQPRDDEKSLRAFLQDFRFEGSAWRDVEQSAVRALGVARVPEAVILDADRRLRYRGRIDDRYRLSAHRATATTSDLEAALEAVVEGREVATPETAAEGCPIEPLPKRSRREPPTWAGSIASLVQRRCVDCHSPGRIGPFPLTSYREVSSHASGVAEVVKDGRMPPWHADARYGRFANDPRLSQDEKDALEHWLEAGCPSGDLASSPAPAPTSPGWEIPTPHVVVSMPVEFKVPAEGVVEYQKFEVPLRFSSDVWVQAAEIRPGNRAVVHHCNVFLKPPDSKTAMTAGALGSFCLAATTQGTRPMVLPQGMAKRIPAGWSVQFVVHYTPIGKPQTDRTSLGLVLADPNSVRKEVATHLLVEPNLNIPPNVGDYEAHKSWKAPADVLLLAFFPHMHLRGKSFEYVAEYPSGDREVLLSVPRYDFGWQHRYVLAEPKRLPRGSVLHCTAVYDNSAGNPANPDPNARVKTGEQSTDEMFNGYFDWAAADQDLIAEQTWPRRLGRLCSIELAVLLLFLAAGVFIRAKARDQQLNPAASQSTADLRSDSPV